MKQNIMKLFFCFFSLFVIVDFCGCDIIEERQSDVPDIQGKNGIETNKIILSDNEVLNENDYSNAFKQIPEGLNHAENYYIHWVIPYQAANICDENIVKVNAKLEEDGYDFGLKVIRIKETLDTDEYEEGIYKYADIAYTGMGLNGKNLAETMLNEGRLFDFTGLANNSPYFINMNTFVKEAITIKGKMYFFPNEISQDGNKQYILSSNEDTEMSSALKNDILKLEKYISEENKLFYGWTGLDFTRCFGYDYDTVRGIVAGLDGTIVNPFEDEKCLSWLKMIKGLYDKGLVQNINSDAVRYSCSTFLTFEKNDMDADIKELNSWQRRMCKRILSTTVIMNASEKKEKAYQLLELLRTNHDYGNLLVYGHIESQVVNEEPDAFNVKNVFGIDDGLLKGELGMNHFCNIKERNSFYQDNVEASVTLYMDLPFECTELRKIVEKYLGYNNSILFCDSFEEKMEELKREYTEKLNEIKSIMKDE